jgi:hypothetical protein|tara:strand:- start:216 stop:326 length:111 start_codon:yes stop_codon:yes gene_type:complete
MPLTMKLAASIVGVAAAVGTAVRTIADRRFRNGTTS